HAPVVVDSTDMFVIEDVSPVTFCFALENDTDPDGDPLYVTNAGTYDGYYGQLELAPDGSYIYRMWTEFEASDEQLAQAHSLADGEIDHDSFDIFVTDGKAPPVLAHIIIEVDGTEDPPVFDDVVPLDHYEAMPLGADGNQADSESFVPSISMDGR